MDFTLYIKLGRSAAFEARGGGSSGYCLRSLPVLWLVCTSISAFAHSTDFRQFFVSVPSVEGTTGIIYHQRDLSNPRRPCELAKGTKGHRLSFVDQEGGRVRRLRDLPKVSAEEIGAAPMSQFEAVARQIAVGLRASCIDVNLAPVADAHRSKVSVMRSRSYSQDPTRAGRLAEVFARQMRKEGIVPTWKHFPGYSQFTVEIRPLDLSAGYFRNNRFESLVDFADKTTLERGISAFKSAEPDMVMISQSIYPAIDSRPAVLVASLADRARQLQPRSLLITDDLSELRLTNIQVLEIFRNVDLMLITAPADVQRFEALLESFLRQGLISRGEVDEKLCRQQRWRAQVNLPLLSVGVRCIG